MSARPFYSFGRKAFPCALINPRSVRRFAEAVGALEKTEHRRLHDRPLRNRQGHETDGAAELPRNNV